MGLGEPRAGNKKTDQGGGGNDAEAEVEVWGVVVVKAICMSIFVCECSEINKFFHLYL